MRYWSDYARTYFHPRSIVYINDYELGSTIMPFEMWESGDELFNKLDKEQDVLDRDIRAWTEECDQIQGFQIFLEADDAWGGFGSKYVDNLRDEYGKTAIWIWGLEEEAGLGERTKQLLRATNTAKTLQDIATQASMYVPLTVPSQHLPSYLHVDLKSQWQLSGLLSLAVESMTLPSRLRPQNGHRGSLSDIAEALNLNGNQRIANLQCSLSDASSLEVTRDKNREVVNGAATSSLNAKDLVFEDELQETNSRLDMDFSNVEADISGISIRQWERSNRHFGIAHTFRGPYPSDADTDDRDELSFVRKRRRLALLPLVEKYSNFLNQPDLLLTKFAKIPYFSTVSYS